MVKFSQCLDAMNCHMLAGMTTGIKAQDERALFIHQMIPHHVNAVNMAKALIKTGKTVCEDLANDEDPDCILEGILYGTCPTFCCCLLYCPSNTSIFIFVKLFAPTF